MLWTVMRIVTLTEMIGPTILAQADLIPKIPTADQAANYTPVQYMQALLWISLTGLAAVIIYLLRKQNENSKRWNDQSDKLFATLVTQYEKQDERYAAQEARHQIRDERTIEVVRVGLSDISKEIASAFRELKK